MSLVLAERPGLAPFRNDLTWKPYVYRGQGPFLAEEPEPEQEECWCGGDMRGYRRHLDRREKPCQASRDDVNLYSRTRRTGTRQARAHQAAGGKPRCGNRGTLLAGDDGEVTCKACLGFMNGTRVRPPSTLGRVQADVEPCGTHAAYQRHRRREGKPVRCEECLAGERRRNQDRAEAS